MKSYEFMQNCIKKAKDTLLQNYLVIIFRYVAAFDDRFSGKIF